MPANRRQQQSLVTSPQVVCITGAKGGIGKTNLSINLGVATQLLGKQAMLFDADLSLANVDVLLGLKPQRNLSHVINNECNLIDIVIEGPQGLRIIPASSGAKQLCQLSMNEYMGIINAFNELTEQVDLFIVDTAAGLTEQVIHFIRASNEIIIVVCNEPGSMTDAYAQIKVMSQDYGIDRFRIVTNMVKSQHEGKLLFHKLKKTADQFLDVTIDYTGSIPFDEHMRLAGQQQKSILEVYPHAKASQAFESLAKTILSWPTSTRNLGLMQFFFDRFMVAPLEENREALA